MPRIEDTARIVNKLGLHARPAALLVQEAGKYAATIELEYNETRVNAKSIMGVMMLAAACGSDLSITADGDDAAEAIEGIKKLIASKFDED